MNCSDESQHFTHPINSSQGRRLFRQRLLRWYDRYRRDLPWRVNHDPYRVWVSEIMLQQTRVAAVVQHYERFLKRFPVLEAFSRARLSSVLAVWSGLGYYRRARMMHAAAKIVVNELGGRFPETASQLRTLPGIGRYTGAAVASIAFDEPIAVVDGNVRRVLQRLLGSNLTDEESWEIAYRLLSRRRPGDFNEAIMELGSTVCLPRAPKCLTCPLGGLCNTRGEAANPRKPSVQQKRRIGYTLDLQDGSVFLVQRSADASLMPRMWELPEISATSIESPWMKIRHSITVTDYTVFVVKGPPPAGATGRWVPCSKVRTLPLTGLARKILRASTLI